MLSHALEPLSNAFALLRDSLRANAGDSEGFAYGTCALNSGGCSPGTVQRDMRKRKCRQTKLVWLWRWSLRYCVGQMPKWCLKAVSHFFSSEYSNIRNSFPDAPKSSSARLRCRISAHAPEKNRFRFSYAFLRIRLGVTRHHLQCSYRDKPRSSAREVVVQAHGNLGDVRLRAL